MRPGRGIFCPFRVNPRIFFHLLSYPLPLLRVLPSSIRSSFSLSPSSFLLPVFPSLCLSLLPSPSRLHQFVFDPSTRCFFFFFFFFFFFSRRNVRLFTASDVRQFFWIAINFLPLLIFPSLLLFLLLLMILSDQKHTVRDFSFFLSLSLFPPPF